MIFPQTKKIPKTSSFPKYSKSLLLLLAFLVVRVGFAQSKIDSISQQIERENSSSEIAHLQLKRALLFNLKEREKASNDIDEAFEYFRNNGDKRGEVDCYISYGNLHFQHRDPIKAAHFDSLAIKLADEISYKKGKAVAIGNLAREFINTGNFINAETHLQISIRHREALGA